VGGDDDARDCPGDRGGFRPGSGCDQLDARRAEAEGTIDVEVISAYELEPEQRKRIADAMHKRLGKKIEILTRIDESLIGGAIIRAGDSVIDASLRGRLTQLKNDFAE